MERKLVKQGNTSVIVSLPIEWIRKHQLKQGDVVEISETGSDILISLAEEKRTVMFTINCDVLDRSTLYMMLLNLYQKGYDEVRINYSKKIPDYEKNNKVDAAVKIKSWLPRFVGWEIMQQQKGSILIRDITGPSLENPQNLLQRVFFLISSFLEQKDTSRESSDEFYETALKLINLAIRIVHKRKMSEENIFLLRLLHKITQLVKEVHPKLSSAKKLAEVRGSLYEQIMLLRKALVETGIMPEMNRKRFQCRKMIENINGPIKQNLYYLQHLIKETVYVIDYLRLN